MKRLLFMLLLVVSFQIAAQEKRESTGQLKRATGFLFYAPSGWSKKSKKNRMSLILAAMQRGCRQQQTPQRRGGKPRGQAR